LRLERNDSLLAGVKSLFDGGQKAFVESRMERFDFCMARRPVRITNCRRSRSRFAAEMAGKFAGTDLACGIALGLAMNEILKPLQVYIVEDSTILRRLLASTIEAAGAELVGSSAGAQSAIADLSTLQPDLILIDIRLNSGSGFDVLRALQEQKLVPAAIKVVLTNFASAENENLSLRLGANRFFDKSSETSQVLALINVLAAERLQGGNRPRGSRHDPGSHSSQN